MVVSTVANAVAPTPSPVITTSGGDLKYPLPPNVTIILSIFPLMIDGYATAPLPLIRLIVGSYVCCDPAFVMVILSTGLSANCCSSCSYSATTCNAYGRNACISRTTIYNIDTSYGSIRNLCSSVRLISACCSSTYNRNARLCCISAPPLVTLIAVTEPVITTSAVGALLHTPNQLIQQFVYLQYVMDTLLREDLPAFSALYLLP